MTLRYAPAASRNRPHILEVLRRVLPERGLVLEIASGTGEHVTWFAPSFPGLRWQPSDPDPLARSSVQAWIDQTGAEAVLPPLDLDVTAPWPPLPRPPAAILCINMLHIAPWGACQGLMAGAGGGLAPGGLLYLYGPFRVGGAMSDSNVRFDNALRARDPTWGVRDLEAVTAEAEARGLALEQTVEMPANNLSVIFRRG